jgi:transcriptional regulator with XRE-family HTH domain
MPRKKAILQPQRSTTPADKSLGEKIKTRRLQAGMSQTDLGEVLGVSFQQVQKYEKGASRVSEARLSEIASALGEGIAFFTSDSSVSKAGREVQSLMTDPLNLRACRALSAIKDQEQRYKWVRLMETVSGINEDD